MENIRIRDSFVDYLGKTDYLSSSDLTLLAKSPAHYMGRVQKPETEKQRLGSALHKLVLEPGEFLNVYTCLLKKDLPEPDKDFRSTKNKEYKEEFVLSAAENKQIVLKEDEWDHVQAMANSLLTNTRLSDLLPGGITEESYYFKASANNIKVKLRPDMTNEQKGYYISLKTTKDASPEGFARECINYGYTYKEAFYLDFLNDFHGTEVYKKFFFAVVENEAPYHSVIYEPDWDFIEKGRADYKAFLGRYISSRSQNEWRGYDFFCGPDNKSRIVELSLPSYHANKTLYI